MQGQVPGYIRKSPIPTGIARWTRPVRLAIVGDMGKADVLDRVAADLAAGRTTPAIQRLSSLVAAHPTDLDLRRRLAAAYRLVGNPVQAGRWGYLNADADPAETGAFERAYPSILRRLRELRWPAGGQAATEFARARLADLGAHRIRPGHGSPVRRRAIVLALAYTALVTPVAALAALGAITVVQWFIG